MNKMAQGDADSIFHYFERSSEELAILDKYGTGISLNESIGSPVATNKVNLHFENIVHF